MKSTENVTKRVLTKRVLANTTVLTYNNYYKIMYIILMFLYVDTKGKTGHAVSPLDVT